MSMTLKEYQKFTRAARLDIESARVEVTISASLLEMAGEDLKKASKEALRPGTLPPYLPDVMDKLSEALFYIARVADCYHVNLEDVMDLSVKKLRADQADKEKSND